jgi:hypothetical protein
MESDRLSRPDRCGWSDATVLQIGNSAVLPRCGELPPINSLKGPGLRRFGTRRVNDWIGNAGDAIARWVHFMEIYNDLQAVAPDCPVKQSKVVIIRFFKATKQDFFAKLDKPHAIREIIRIVVGMVTSKSDQHHLCGHVLEMSYNRYFNADRSCFSLIPGLLHDNHS